MPQTNAGYQAVQTLHTQAGFITEFASNTSYGLYIKWIWLECGGW